MKRLYDDFKKTDWLNTELYVHFLQNGKWVDGDENIYSEIELKYLFCTVQSMTSKTDQQEEFQENEGALIVNKHSEKIFTTLEVLLNHLNMQYFWQRLKIYFQGREPELDEMSKMIIRCLKLYDCINDIMRLFKQMGKFEVSYFV